MNKLIFLGRGSGYHRTEANTSAYIKENETLFISITSLIKRGKVIPVAHIQLLNYTLELYHNYVECIHKNKMKK